MPRNQSEQVPAIPTSLPLPDAPQQDLSVKFHERLFWNRGRLALPNDWPEKEMCRAKYRAVTSSFSDEEHQQYVSLNWVEVYAFYSTWWTRYIDRVKAAHAAQSK